MRANSKKRVSNKDSELDSQKLLKMTRLTQKSYAEDDEEYVPRIQYRKDKNKNTPETESFQDFSDITLKRDHAKRPLWVLPNKKILLEVFSPSYKAATEFLVSIAEPKSRPAMIHEYELTTSSLYSAISLKYTSEKIISILTKLAKSIDIPDEIKTFIRDHTSNFGKAKCVLYKNRYFIEVDDDVIYEKIANLEPIKDFARKLEAQGNTDAMEILPDTQRSDLYKMLGKREEELLEGFENMLELNDDNSDGEHEGTKEENIKRLEFDSKDYEIIKKQCNDMKIPLKEEYEYTNPTKINPELDIKLKPTTNIRGYQAKALAKMFNNNRAQSGIIVLPCGAGKSLVGVCAAAVVKKRTIVFCNSNQSVKQWVLQFKTWTQIDPRRIVQFVSRGNTNRKAKDSIIELIRPEEPIIVVTTYSMMYGNNGAAESKAIRAKLQTVEWGLSVLDEVHVVPANTFKEAITVIKSHCKLGLTATLLREDNKIDNLEYLIGPKLYEENWKDLENNGYLARVLCCEIRCEMTDIFYREYKKQASHWKKSQLYLANPEKFFALQYLIRYHETRKDKILVFSDNIFILTKYAKLLNKMCIHGKISHDERIKVLDYFQKDDKYNVLFISKIGDTSIDLPDANVLIQISSHYGSRRQEAQRLGRILRPKERSQARYNAFFYTIVSLDTEETIFSRKRQTFLIDQGFTFKILTNKDFSYYYDNYIKNTFKLASDEEQKDLLIEILALDDPRNLKQSSSDDDDGGSDEEVQITTHKVTGVEHNALKSLYIDYTKE